MTTRIIMNVSRPNGSGGTYKAGTEYDLPDDLAELWRGQGICRRLSVRSEQTGVVIQATSGNYPVAPALDDQFPLMGSTSSSGVVELLGDGLDPLRYGYDVVVALCGQSNADGRGALYADEPVAPGAMLYSKTEAVVPLSEPSGYTGYPDGEWINNAPTSFDETARGLLAVAAAHSAATSFGREFLRLTGLRPLIIPCAIGSTSFSDWLPPTTEDDPTTLFGAATRRVKNAMGKNTPIIVWLVGHEKDAMTAGWNLRTGTAGTAYTALFRSYIYNWRKRFPGAYMLYGQLASHSTGSLAISQASAGEEQRRFESAVFAPTPSSIYEPAVPVDYSNMTTSGTNATNTATLTGASMRLVSDVSSAVGFAIGAVKSGRRYRLKVPVTGTGSWKLMAAAFKAPVSGAGAISIVFTADANTKLQIFRETACDLTFDLSQMTLEEDRCNITDIRNVMFVEHDLSRNSGADGIHISASGQDMLGTRAARAAAQRIIGISSINGTGPRLVSVTKPAANQVKVKFDREINDSATGYGAALASSLFQIYHNAGTEITLSACVRDPDDTTAVLITTSANYSGTVVVVYGARPGPSDTSMRPGCVYDSDGLPAPAFMQVAA